MKKLSILLIFVVVSCTPLKMDPLLEGDCVDRVIQQYEHLESKGYEVNIILGTYENHKGETEGHAWLKYRKNESDEWEKWRNL